MKERERKVRGQTSQPFLSAGVREDVRGIRKAKRQLKNPADEKE